jgi:hypothetical protein
MAASADIAIPDSVIVTVLRAKLGAAQEENVTLSAAASHLHAQLQLANARIAELERARDGATSTAPADSSTSR